MPRPAAPPTPSSSTDLKSLDGSCFMSSQASFELPPPALTSDSSSSRTSSASSFHPYSPPSHPLPTKSRATTSKKRTAPTKPTAKSAEPFTLPPPPTRARKIIQMKPSAAEASSPTGQPTKAAPSGKRKSPSATSVAGKKMARKTAHSLIERRRRSKMNEEFGVLKDMIPACSGEMHKLAILQASIEYVRYLEDCVAQLKAQNTSCHTPTFARTQSPPDSFPDAHPHAYAHSSCSASDDSDSDVEMLAGPPDAFTPAFPPAATQQPVPPPPQHHQLPLPSPPLYPQDARPRTLSYTHSASTSPAFGPQVYSGGQWAGSAASSAVTSPALGPLPEEETATVALMMLNADWRMGAERRRGMSVRELLCAT